MRAVDFYTRMLFSALVDADRLDTEMANDAPGTQSNVRKRKAWRFGEKCLATQGVPESLIKMLDAAIADRVKTARAKNASPAVLDVRAEVLDACKQKGASSRGVFTLAVPTGGGKTLASIAFALRHIAHHNQNLASDDPQRLRRIIVVIPYLNIIQQTTREMTSVFAHADSDPLILEHHSQATDPKIPHEKDDADGYDKARPLRQLAAENWDAPIIEELDAGGDGICSSQTGNGFPNSVVPIDQDRSSHFGSPVRAFWQFSAFVSVLAGTCCKSDRLCKPA